MNLLGLTITRTKPAPVQRALSPSALAWLGADTPTAPLLSNAYQQVVWVYRAINAIAEQVANIPFRFSTTTGSGEQVITSGPLLDFYDRPHPHINRFQYWELRVIWLMLRGESIRIPIFGPPRPSDGRGVRREGLSNLKSQISNSPAPRGERLQSVVILDPARFQHIIQDNRLIGWRYIDYSRNTPLASQVFLPEEVWHEKLPNPFDFWRGMSPLAVAANAAATDYAAPLFMKGIMENNGDAGTILRTADQLDPEQREQILAALRERKRRAGTADRPVLLWGGAEVVTPKLSSSDLQFLANRKYSCTEICTAFGVPEEIITSTNNAKYDVMAGARLNFIENRVVPICRRLEAEEQVAIKNIDPSAHGWFDVEDHPVLTAARRDRLTAARIGFDMGIPFNELNRAFDLGFKPLPWGDLGHIPTTMQPASGPPPSAGAAAKSEYAGTTPPIAHAPPLVLLPHAGAMQDGSRGSQHTHSPHAGATPPIAHASPLALPHGGAMKDGSRGSERSADPRITTHNINSLSPRGTSGERGRGEGSL